MKEQRILESPFFSTACAMRRVHESRWSGTAHTRNHSADPAMPHSTGKPIFSRHRSDVCSLAAFVPDRFSSTRKPTFRTHGEPHAIPRPRADPAGRARDAERPPRPSRACAQRRRFARATRTVTAPLLCGARARAPTSPLSFDRNPPPPTHPHLTFSLSLLLRQLGLPLSYHGQYRTAQPDSLRHRRLRMTGTEPHAPGGTAGRGPNWDRGPCAGHAGAARRCTTRHRRPWAQPGPSAVYGPRELHVDTCSSRHRRPRDHSWDRGLRAGRRSGCSTRSGSYASTHAHLGTACRETTLGIAGRTRA